MLGCGARYLTGKVFNSMLGRICRYCMLVHVLHTAVTNTLVYYLIRKLRIRIIFILQAPGCNVTKNEFNLARLDVNRESALIAQSK
jgi:hypothetical protein